MRQDYCPIVGAPCQSMCDEPCLSAAKKRIAKLELALQKQAKAALLGMDAAKANGDVMLKAATEIQNQVKPELLDSERQANAVLTDENGKLQRQIEQLREALEKIADLDGNWGPFPETNKQWCAMAVVTAREALEETR